MSPKYESLLNDAMHLSTEERQMLSEQLELSLLGLTESELVHAWASLSDKRYKEYQSGNASVFEVKDVIEEARKRNRP